MTAEQEQIGREHYATLTLGELRRYQAIVQAQIPLAFEQRKTEALDRLQTMDTLVAEAIYNKAFS
jgi:hypothetical protein